MYASFVLPFDASIPFSAASDNAFFTALPARAGIFLLEMPDPGAEPYLARTSDLRRAAERLLRPTEVPSKRLNLSGVVKAIQFRCTGSKFEQAIAFYGHARSLFPNRYRDMMKLRTPALLKVNLRNEYPRCYVTRRIRDDGGFYFGPFMSRQAADGFAEKFLDLFKTRRCQIKIRRDPKYPGCVYSEMKMCLAPCFAGCSKEEYDAEMSRLVAALGSGGLSLTEEIEREREAASEALDFERAANLHKRLEKADGVLRGLPEIAHRLENLDALILQKSAQEKVIVVFPVLASVVREPIFLRFDDVSGQPRSVESFLRGELTNLAERSADTRPSAESVGENLALIARWFYSNPRDGELFFRDGDWLYRRILRACGRLLAAPAPPQPIVPAKPSS